MTWQCIPPRLSPDRSGHGLVQTQQAFITNWLCTVRKVQSPQNHNQDFKWWRVDRLDSRIQMGRWVSCPSTGKIARYKSDNCYQWGQIDNWTKCNKWHGGLTVDQDPGSGDPDKRKQQEADGKGKTDWFPDIIDLLQLIAPTLVNVWLKTFSCCLVFTWTPCSY